MNDALSPALAAPDVQAQLQRIVDHTSAAVFIKDLDGRFLFVNRDFERIRGILVEAIVGCLDREIFPSTAAELRRNDLRVIDERRAIDFEESVETTQGRRVYLAHKFPLIDTAGRPYAVCGIATDITDRKRSEDALRAAALAVSSAEGERVFGELARYLAEVLDVDVALISVFADADRTAMRTLAARLDGKALANFEYPLEDSPCRAVAGRAFRFVSVGVNPEFPPGTIFAAKGMDSYAALPLNDASGQPLGLIAAMDREPMRDPALAEAIMKISRCARCRDRAHARRGDAPSVRGELSRDLRRERGPDLRPRLGQRRNLDVSPKAERRVRLPGRQAPPHAHRGDQRQRAALH